MNNKRLFLALVVLALAACSREPELDAPVSTIALGLGSTTAVADAYVRSGSPNQNQGADTILRVQDSGNNRSLVRFDQAQITSIVGGDTLVSATIELSIADNGNNWGTTGRTIDVHRVTTSWTESGATWNCAVDANPSNSSADCSGATVWTMGNVSLVPWETAPADRVLITNGQSGVVSLDVTADVLAFLQGTKVNEGFVIKKSEEASAGRVDFAARQTATPPRLVIVTSPVPPPPPPPASGALVQASGDSYLRQGSPNKNQGSLLTLRLQASGDNRSLVQIDEAAIEAAIGARTLLSAHLELTIAHNGDNWGATGRTLELHRMTTSWSENNATWNCAVDTDPSNGATDCSGATAWSMGASDVLLRPYVAATTASTTITNGQGGVLSLDVMADVQIFRAGTPNRGWVLKKTDENASGLIELASRETSSGPRLVLIFSPDDSDSDGDGVQDADDNCPILANTDQADADADDAGDACDLCPFDADDDIDIDDVCGDVDNCPLTANVDQSNADGDALGDVCDACALDAANDADTDGVCGNVDNCPELANATQANADADTLGDACDACASDPANDVDADGVCGDVDNCPALANATQANADADALGDLCDACANDADNDVDADGICGDLDNCAVLANTAQADRDADDLGDVCDACALDAANDVDADGVCGNVDNCPTLANAAQQNADADTLGDACDACPSDPANDVDSDGVCGNIDNCPALANATQANADGDSLGDACDACALDAANDAETDGVCGDVDNCPTIANESQANTDGDAQGDACDLCPLDADNDIDIDDVCGDVDNCPLTANVDQSNADGDALGDVCDACALDAANDADTDGVCGNVDNCPELANATQANADADTLGDACDACASDPANDVDADGVCGDVDNCPALANATQANADADALGDLCDACANDADNDVDADGICGDLDNCAVLANTDQADGDADDLGNVCDACALDAANDVDEDGVCGNLDNCPLSSNADQTDGDSDGLGDACDSCDFDVENDADGDGVCEQDDNCPLLTNVDQADDDGDGIGDLCDACAADAANDADGDGLCGNADNCPTFSNVTQADGDSDDLGDPCDACPTDATNDVDSDGICGGVDNCPNLANATQADSDADAIGDLCDSCANDGANDADGDGRCGDIDNCPSLVNSAQTDTDGDDAGDACDACPFDAANDSDHDGLCADVDNCPSLANADQVDADGDDLGNLCDPCPDDPTNDRDGDGICGNTPDAGPGEALEVVVETPSEDAYLGAETFAVNGSISGGREPIVVTVEGTTATRAGATFTATISAPDGDVAIDVIATDADGQQASVTRTVHVDRSPPILNVTRPAEASSLAHESPYTVQGIALDANLASVTVDGVEVFVLAGQFLRSVPLALGSNNVVVRARDLAGNISTVQRTLLLEDTPPVVSFLSPADGTVADASSISVRVRVVSTSPLASVTIGGITAGMAAVEEYEATVPLALGDNVLSALAVDENGLSGSAELRVRYSDPAVEPLRVVLVSPAAGAGEVEPDTIVSLSFNKAIDDEQTLDVKLLAEGVELPVGYFLAPGNTMLSVIARTALPEGKRIELRARDLAADVGPGLPSYSSAFTVRKPLTIVSGAVLDAELGPIVGARVLLEGTDASTTTSRDGTFAFVKPPTGLRSLLVDGGLSPDGRPYARVRRRLVIEPERSVEISPTFLAVVDTASTQQLGPSGVVVFTGESAGLRIEASGAQFEDGRTSGYVTATPLPPFMSWAPLETRFSPVLLWQLQPLGMHFPAGASVEMPNPRALPAGRTVLIVAHDSARDQLTFRGLGHVDATGAKVVADDSLVGPTLEIVGYVPLTAEQELLATTPPSGTGGTQGSLLDRLLKRFFIGEAHAQLISSAFAQILERIVLQTVGEVGVVRGAVVGPGEDTDSPTAFGGMVVELGASGLSTVTHDDGTFGVAVPTYGGIVDEVAIVRFPFNAQPAFFKDAEGNSHVEFVNTSYYARSQIFPLAAGATFHTTVPVDARILIGTVTFVAPDGAALPPFEPGAVTALDPVTHELLSISKADLETTEVHFFKEDRLDLAIAKIAAVGAVDGGQVHGRFARLRLGPTDTTSSSRAQPDPRALRRHDRVVMFAINHATGYAGMTTVEVPLASDAANGLEVRGDIKLFPPEIDVRVKRKLTPRGVQQPMTPSLVRAGGMATTSDDFIAIETHWRVRRAPHATDDADAGIAAGTDAGHLLTQDDPADGGAGPLVDEGVAGAPLEVLCTQLEPNATLRERLECLNDDRTLADVPGGVPPLAGQALPVTLLSGVPRAFPLKPGARLSVVEVARRTNPAVVNGLDVANWFVHIVGRQALPRDIDGNSVLSAEELDTPPPDFTSEPAVQGLPTKAIVLKNIYTARLRPESGGPVRKVASFDRLREHQFRVVSVAPATVTEVDGDIDDRPVPENRTDFVASDEATSYDYLLSLLQPPNSEGRDVGRAGDYEVRLGGDALGVTCEITTTNSGSGASASGTCGGDDLTDVLSGQDIVYLELFLSGNSDNVLYRLNWYGISNRRDYVSAGSNYTLDRATTLDPPTNQRLNRAPQSDPNRALFFIDPNELKNGTIDIMASNASTPLRTMDVTFNPATSTYTATATGGSSTATVSDVGNGALGASYFEMPLPATLAALVDGDVPATVSVIYRPANGGASLQRAVGKPFGRLESRAIEAPGHASFYGIDIADGHFAMADEDLRVPERGTFVTFEHHYNNQNNELTPLGLGFTHNHDVFIVEEAPGRYSVVEGGQAKLFPACTDGVACESDKSHDGTLMAAHVPHGAGSDLAVNATYDDHANGRVLTFSTPSVASKREGRRKTLLTSIDDGKTGLISYSYVASSDRLDKVARSSGLFELRFQYETISSSDQTIHPRVRSKVRTEDHARLSGVKIVKAAQPSVVIDELVFTHDLGTASGCARGPVSNPGRHFGLLMEICRPMGDPKPHWRFSYVTAPQSSSSPGQMMAVANEIATADLLFTETAQPEGLSQRWTLDRMAPSGNTTASPRYRHLDTQEIVTKMKGPGMKNPAEVRFTGANDRSLVRPDGVVHNVALTPYGSVKSESVASRTFQSTWKNDSEGTRLVDAKRVLPETTGRTNGDSAVSAFDAVRHRATDVTTTLGCTSCSSPRGVNAEGAVKVETPTHNGRFGIPTSMTFPGGNGTTTASTIDVSTFGDVQGVSINTGVPGQTVGFNVAHNSSGLPTTGTDLAGNTVTYSGADASFEQRTQLVTSLPAGGTPTPTGLQTVTRQFTYDALGRLTGVKELETGRESTWVLDAVGRMRDKTVRGGASQDQTTKWTYVSTQASASVEVELGGTVREKTTLDANRLLEKTERDGAFGTETTAYVYGGDGLLQSRTESNRGASTVYTYNANNKWLDSESTTLDGAASTTAYTRDTNGNLLTTTMTDHRARVTTVEHDKLGQPIRWSYGSASGSGSGGSGAVDTERVERDVQGNIVKRVWGPNDRHVVDITIDQVGRVTNRTSVADPTDVSDVMGYDRAGRLTSSTKNPSQLAETYEYNDVLGRPTKRVRAIETVDESGVPLSLTTTEERTYTESPGAREIVVSETSDASASGAPLGPRTKTVALSLDAMDRIVSVTETLPSGAPHTVVTRFDAANLVREDEDAANGLLSTTTMDAQGSVVLVEHDGGAQTQIVVVATDSAGTVRTRDTDGPHPDAVWFEGFNAYGEPIERTLFATTTLPEMKTTWSYTGAVASETPPEGAPIARTTNARGLLLEEAQGPRTTTYSYDGTQVERATTVEGSWELDRTWAYDDGGRVTNETETWTAMGAGYNYATATNWTGRDATVVDTWAAGERTETRNALVTVDSLGELARREQIANVLEVSVRDAAGRPIVTKGANTAPVTSTFVEGRLTSEDFAGEVTSYSYDAGGRVASVTDPLGHSVTTTYWPMGQPRSRLIASFTMSNEAYDEGGYLASRTTDTSTWGFASGPMGELTSVTLPGGLGAYAYEYAKDRKLTKITPPGGVVQTFEYVDPLRRPTKRTRGTSAWSTTSWANNTSTVTDPLSHAITTLLDGRGRAALTTYAGAPGLTSVAIDYDGLDQPLKVVEQNTLSGNATTTYGYDARSRVTSIARSGAPNVGYGYVDAPTSLTVTESVASLAGEARTFNQHGRLDLVVVAGTKTHDLSYRPDGLLQSIASGTLTEARRYDDATGTKQILGVDYTGSATSSLDYTYDLRGNRLTETFAGEVTRYGYDAADRLTGVRYPGAKADLYLLRGDGARAEEKSIDGYSVAGALGAGAFATPGGTLTRHARYGFDGADGLASVHDLLATTTKPIVTDAAGRLTSMPLDELTRELTWDAAGRLGTVVDTDGTTPTTVANYSYDFQGWRTRKVTPDEDVTYVWGKAGVEAEQAVGGPMRDYVHGAGMVLSVGEEMFGHDALGSPVVRVNTGVATQTRFDAWGRIRSLPTTGPPWIAGDNQTAFTGHNRDVETELVYAQARYLDPSTGRFLSLDPFGGALDAPMSTQGFTYAHGSPTRFSDPTGRCVFGVECTPESFDDITSAAAEEVAGLASRIKETAKQVARSARDRAAARLGRAVTGEQPFESPEPHKAIYNVGAHAVQRAADSSVRWQDAGASGVETVRGVVSDLSGMTAAAEDATGATLEGDPLSLTGHYERRVEAFTKIATTSLALASLGGGRASTAVSESVASETSVAAAPIPRRTYRVGEVMPDGRIAGESAGAARMEPPPPLSPRAARRTAMREAGMPTSQQPRAQSSSRAPGTNEPVGRQYDYDRPTPGGGPDTPYSVQHSLTDDVPGHGPHWEAGRVKLPLRRDAVGRPRLTNQKARVDE